jgi:hypothetical protein
MTTVGDGYALDIVTGRSAGPGARTTYLGLSTGTIPAVNASMTTVTASEYAATGYARQAVTWTAPTTADPAVTQNSAILTFGPFTASVSGTIQTAFLCSASTGTTGDYLAQWTLTTSRTPVTGDSLSVAAGALTLSQQ